MNYEITKLKTIYILFLFLGSVATKISQISARNRKEDFNSEITLINNKNLSKTPLTCVICVYMHLRKRLMSHTHEIIIRNPSESGKQKSTRRRCKIKQRSRQDRVYAPRSGEIRAPNGFSRRMITSQCAWTTNTLGPLILRDTSMDRIICTLKLARMASSKCAPTLWSFTQIK
jgi:hypothetical protein